METSWPTGPRLVSRLWAFITLTALGAIVSAIAAGDPGGVAYAVVISISAAGAFAPIGALIVRRRGNAVGWALLGLAAGLAVSTFAAQYAAASIANSEILPAWRQVAWMGSWVFVLMAGCLALLLLLFPSGRLPSRRWRIVLWAGTAGVAAAAVGIALNPVRFTDSMTPVSFQNPFGLERFGGFVSAVIAVGAWLAIPAGILAIASLVVRFRGAGRDDRERIKWLAYVAVTGASFLFVGEIVSWAAGCEVKCGDAVFAVFFAAMSIGIPAAVGGAILRHGLYDIDIVIRKTVVVAVFATFFVAIYALVVGGVGALISTSSNAALSFAAAAIVAILFQPVLTRARKFADLVVYGKRATPYEVLAEFSGRMAGHANDVVLAEMARVVGEGTGATRSEVWLRLGGNLHPAGAWPAD